MFARMTIAGLAVVVLIALEWRLSIMSESRALAQQAGPQAQKPAASQPGGLVARSSPTAEELRAMALTAEEWIKNNPQGKTQAVERPQVKDNACPMVSAEERERMGLPSPVWVAKYGKVQPAVRDALGEQRRLIAMPNSMAEFQTDRPSGFQGTVYVDIYLRHDAKGSPNSTENLVAIKKVEDRLLNELNAWEFRTIFVFTRTAGLAGYIDEGGLAKVAEDPDVVAVGLDDQARPERPPIALREESEDAARRRRERKGKVDAEVYEKLNESSSGYVYVIVPILQPGRREMSLDEREARAWQIHTRILSSLSAAEFKLWGQGSSGGFNGWANAAGLANLERHPDVAGVGLTGRPSPRQ